MSIGNKIDKILQETKYQIGDKGGIICLGAAMVIGSTAMITAPTWMGWGIGEAADQIPYFRDAIPKGIEYIANIATQHQTNISTYLTGNLDKVGAATGFFGNLLLLNKGIAAIIHKFETDYRIVKHYDTEWTLIEKRHVNALLEKQTQEIEHETYLTQERTKKIELDILHEKQRYTKPDKK